MKSLLKSLLGGIAPLMLVLSLHAQDAADKSTVSKTNNGCLTLCSFHDSNLDGFASSWLSATVNPTSTNLSISASGFGDGYKAVSPSVTASNSMKLMLDVTITASDVVGPLVVLQDDAGNQIRYAWYNTPAGHNVLTIPLKSGTMVVGKTFDYSKITYFHLQIDPEGVKDSYTIVFNDLSVAPDTASSTSAGDGAAASKYGTAVDDTSH